MRGIEDGMACESRRAGLGAPMAITAPTAAGRRLRLLRPLAGACGLHVRRLAVLQPLALLLPFWCARGWVGRVAVALESGPARRKRKAATLVILRRDALHATARRQGKQISSKSS
ncbi:unnamed protein product [Urochloa humidicola]